jgi:hypothetical protein
MSKKDICIIVAAQGISNETIRRFKQSVRYSSPQHQVDIIIRSGEEQRFYKTRILNSCLRDTIDKYNVIIQTDIDLLIPPGLIDRTYDALMKQPNNAYHHNLRYIEPIEIEGKQYKDYPWHTWNGLPHTFCSGCWNGMMGKTWMKTGGWNEDMFAWSNDDTDLYNRTRLMKIKWIKDARFALVHVNHPRRQPNRKKENIAAAKQYDIQTNWITGKIIRKKTDV